MTSVRCHGIKHNFSSEEIPISKGSTTFNFFAVLKPNLFDGYSHNKQQQHQKFLLSRKSIRIYAHSVEDILQCLIWCLIIWKVKSYSEGCSKVKEAWQCKSCLSKGKAWNWSWQMAWDQNQELTDQNSVLSLNIQLTSCFLLSDKQVPVQVFHWIRLFEKVNLNLSEYSESLYSEKKYSQYSSYCSPKAFWKEKKTKKI